MGKNAFEDLKDRIAGSSSERSDNRSKGSRSGSGSSSGKKKNKQGQTVYSGIRDRIKNDAPQVTRNRTSGSAFGQRKSGREVPEIQQPDFVRPSSSGFAGRAQNAATNLQRQAAERSGIQTSRQTPVPPQGDLLTQLTFSQLNRSRAARENAAQGKPSFADDAAKALTSLAQKAQEARANGAELPMTGVRAKDYDKTYAQNLRKTTQLDTKLNQLAGALSAEDLSRTYTRQPDFVQASAYVPAAERQRSRGTAYNGVADVVYDYVNGDKKAAATLYDANPAEFTQRYQRYSEASDKDKRVFNYIYNKYGSEAAMEYMDQAEMQFDPAEAFVYNFGQPIMSGIEGVSKLVSGLQPDEPSSRGVPYMPEESESGFDRIYNNYSRDLISAQQQQPIASTAGSIASNVAEMTMIASGIGSLPGFARVGSAAERIFGSAQAGMAAQKILSGAASMAGTHAINEAGAVATGQISGEEYLRDITGAAIRGAAGGAGSIASGMLAGAGLDKLGQIASKFPKLKNNAIARYVAGTAGMVVEGAGFDFAEALTHIGLDPNAYPDAEAFWEDMIIGFAFSAIDYSKGRIADVGRAPVSSFAEINKAKTTEDLAAAAEILRGRYDHAKAEGDFAKAAAFDAQRRDLEADIQAKQDWITWKDNHKAINAYNELKKALHPKRAAAEGAERAYLEEAQKRFDEALDRIKKDVDASGRTEETADAIEVLEEIGGRASTAEAESGPRETIINDIAESLSLGENGKAELDAAYDGSDVSTYSREFRDAYQAGREGTALDESAGEVQQRAWQAGRADAEAEAVRGAEASVSAEASIRPEETTTKPNETTIRPEEEARRRFDSLPAEEQARIRKEEDRLRASVEEEEELLRDPKRYGLSDEEITEYQGMLKQDQASLARLEEEYGLLLHEGSERNDGARAGEQGSPVEESTGRDQSWNQEARPEAASRAESASREVPEERVESTWQLDKRAKDRSLSKLTFEDHDTNAAELGLKHGTASGRVRLVKGGETKETKRIYREAARRGISRENVVLFAGGDLSFKEGGVEFGARGACLDGKIYVRVDDADYLGSQIAIHEATHHLIATGKLNLDSVRATLAERLGGKEALEEAVALYAQAFEGMDAPADLIFEEMICDAEAGMNHFTYRGEESAREIDYSYGQIRESVKETTSRGLPKEGATSINRRLDWGLDEYSQNRRDWYKSSDRITIAESEQDIIDFVNTILEKRPEKLKTLGLGRIGKDLAARIYADTGVQLEGYNVILRSDFENSHANPEKESSRGQTVITPEIIAKVPQVIGFYDSVKRGRDVWNGKPALHFSKDIDGVKIAVEYVSDRNKTIYLQTMYGWASKKNPATTGDVQASPRTSETDSDAGSFTNTILPAKAESNTSSAETPKMSRRSPAEIKARDESYRKAAESGDTEAAQKMVDEAAKETMPDTKILDEDGNPLVVYHGTSEKFTVFDRTKGRANMDIQGMFFSPWDIDAGGYGENVGKYYLDIRNPASEAEGYKALRRFQGQNNAGVKAREYLISKGYDGVNNGGEEFIAFESNQIKSADAVTYDDNGNVIPLSERFNPENKDIRFSRRAGKEIYQGQAKKAIADAMDHADAGDDNLIRLGDIPDSVSNVTTIQGDLYVYRNHLYENMTTEAAAQAAGRHNKNGHYHELGEEKMEEAILALNRPSIAIAERMKDGNPALTMVLPVFDKNDKPIHAVLSFYENTSVNGRLEKRPHIAVTFYGHEYDSSGGRKGIADIISEGIKDGRVVLYDKNMSNDLPVIAKRVPLGNITDSSLTKNISQFQKEIKDFRNRNKINYSRRSTLEVSRRETADLQQEVNRGLEQRVKDLQKDLEKQTERANKWKRETRRTPEAEKNKVREADAKRVAGRIVKDYGSKTKAADIAPEIRELSEFVRGGGKGSASDTFAEGMAKARQIAEKVISGAEELVEIEPDADTIRSLIGRTMHIAEKDTLDIPDFEHFRRTMFGKMKLVRGTNGVTVDEAYQELSQMYPHYFPREITHPADQVLRMADVLETIKPSLENPYSYDYALATEQVAQDIFAGIVAESNNLVQDSALRTNPPTFADKQQARYEQLIAQNKAKTAEQLARVRQQRDAAIKRLKENHTETSARARERRKATELRGQIQKQTKDMASRLLKPTDKKHFLKSVQPLVAQALDAVNMTSAFSYGADGKHVPAGEGDPTGRTKKFIALREQLKSHKEWLIEGTSLLDDGGSLQKLIDMGDKPISQMTSAELQTVHDALRDIDAVVKNADRTFRIGKTESLSASAEKMRADNIGKKPVGEKLSAGARWMHRLMLDMETPENYFHRFGKVGDQMFRELRNAQDKQTKILKESKDFVKANIKVDPRKVAKQKVTVRLGGKDVTTSMAHLMELYNLCRREQGLYHVLEGGVKFSDPKRFQAAAIRNVTTDELSAAFAQLPIEYKQAADALQKYVSGDLAKHGNEASMEVFGYEKFGNDDYWQIKTDASDRKSDETQRQMNLQNTTVANWGSAKALEPNANSAVVIGDVFDSFAESVSGMAGYAANLAVQQDINRLRNWKFYDEEGKRTGTMKELIDQVHGSGGGQYLEKLMADIAGGMKAEAEYFGGLTGRYKGAAVAANMRVILQQPTAIARAAELIGYKYLNEGLLMGTGKGWKKAKQWAPIAQQKEWGSVDVNTGRTVKEILFENTSPLARTNEFLMSGAAKADAFGWGLLWNACEAETRAKMPDLKVGSDEYYQHVADRFTGIVDHTQVVDGILQRSQIMRNPSSLTKMATSFMGEPIKQFNQLSSAVYDARTSGTPASKKHLAKTARAMLIAGTLNAVAQSIWDAVRDDDKTKDYLEKMQSALFGIDGTEEGWTDYMKKFFSSNMGDFLNPAGYVPYVKDVVSVLQGYDVERMDLAGISGFVTAAQRMIKAMNGEGKVSTENALIGALGEGARLLGVPLANLKRDVMAVTNTVANETGNYYLQYKIADFNYRQAGNKKEFMDILYGAYKNDSDAYQLIREDLIRRDELASSSQTTEEYINAQLRKRSEEDGGGIGALYDAKKSGSKEYDSMYSSMIDSGLYTEEQIAKGMNEQIRDDTGAEKVSDLAAADRFMTPDVEKAYDKAAGEVQKSSAWKNATAEEREKTEKILYEIASGSKTGQKHQEKIDGGKSVGITESEYVTFLLALSAADRKNNANSSYDKTEIQAALDSIGGLSQKEKAYLFSVKSKAKNNPYN